MSIEELSNKFMEEVRSENPDNRTASKYADEILDYYSERISKAIEPNNSITAPFIYIVMSGYMELIEDLFPDAKTIAQDFSKDLESEIEIR